jgi:hypothetical protein
MAYRGQALGTSEDDSHEERDKERTAWRRCCAFFCFWSQAIDGLRTVAAAIRADLSASGVTQRPPTQALLEDVLSVEVRCPAEERVTPKGGRPC